MKARIVRFN